MASLSIPPTTILCITLRIGQSKHGGPSYYATMSFCVLLCLFIIANLHVGMMIHHLFIFALQCIYLIYFTCLKGVFQSQDRVLGDKLGIPLTATELLLMDPPKEGGFLCSFVDVGCLV